MDSEERILEALQRLTEGMTEGFNSMGARFEAIESRLQAQEHKTRKTARRQALQAAELQQLKELVYQMADREPCWRRGNTAAIRKEPVYTKIEQSGISKVAAMRALRDAGAIETDPEGKNTRTIYLNGKLVRVIVVCLDPTEREKGWTKE